MATLMLAAPAAPAAPDDAPPSEVVAHRLTLRGVPWPLYEQLLKLAVAGLPRMT